MRFVLVFTFLLVITGGAQAANPVIETNWKYYSVTGSTPSELRREMKRKGPNGYWAYAKWFVRWTSKCKVIVTLNYTFPEWTNSSTGPQDLQVKWEKMTRALKKHEENHGLHGIKAGREIVANKCRNGRAIIRKWANQDKIYDRNTAHGKKEGVRLP